VTIHTPLQFSFLPDAGLWYLLRSHILCGTGHYVVIGIWVIVSHDGFAFLFVLKPMK